MLSAEWWLWFIRGIRSTRLWLGRYDVVEKCGIVAVVYKGDTLHSPMARSV